MLWPDVCPFVVTHVTRDVYTWNEFRWNVWPLMCRVVLQMWHPRCTFMWHTVYNFGISKYSTFALHLRNKCTNAHSRSRSNAQTHSTHLFPDLRSHATTYLWHIMWLTFHAIHIKYVVTIYLLYPYHIMPQYSLCGYPPWHEFDMPYFDSRVQFRTEHSSRHDLSSRLRPTTVCPHSFTHPLTSSPHASAFRGAPPSSRFKPILLHSFCLCCSYLDSLSFGRSYLIHSFCSVFCSCFFARRNKLLLPSDLFTLKPILLFWWLPLKAEESTRRNKLLLDFYDVCRPF